MPKLRSIIVSPESVENLGQGFTKCLGSKFFPKGSVGYFSNSLGGEGEKEAVGERATDRPRQ